MPTDIASGLAAHLEHNARAFPARPAIIHPDGRGPDGRIRYRELDYGTLQDQVERLAAGFAGIGIGKGTRTVLMAAPGPDLFAIAFALFRLGAVPVIVDPGMGIRRMLHCYRSVGAEAFIGPPVAHVARVLGRRTFARVRIKVTLGRRLFWGGLTLDALRGTAPQRPLEADARSEEVSGEDLMMIGFTTGSTGPAKGVEFTHRMGTAMARELQAAHDRTRDDVSLVTLPLYGMFDLVFGSTLVLAPLAPSRVADADPELLVDALTRFGATTMFASPALLRVLARHMNGSALPPTLRCVVSGGAPVPPALVAELRAVLDEKAEFHVTYGATEVLPIASVESAEILRETALLGALGAGTCVGRPLAGLDVRTIPVSDGPVSRFELGDGQPAGTIGEIVVAGNAVSPGYHGNPEADALHKIREGNRNWHRTGDLGYLDGYGRLWFCGRKSQRVRTAGGDLNTVVCEGVFNAHPLVRRSALVGVGGGGGAPTRPVVCVETEAGVDEARWQAMLPELRALAEAQSVTAGLRDFVRHPAFPVDVRHNAKIGREELAAWATRQLAPVQGRARTWALRAIPLAGWAYLLYGALRPFDALPLAVVWWIDAFLSVVVHAAQIPPALPRGRAAGRSGVATAALTMLYGATWWRTLPTAHRAVRPMAEAKAGAGAS
ncbi:fatty acid CoA ligase family protein [Streptomyces sp. AK02-04a]|uniref:fatty acid CoA ligase family protein n=1 Tax=Streptomyces sp. AK02-04a TaxID=3028649 RepID=UPI0029B4D442|nr:fatty acid CoA ligase family protein [Streptomyces sp. AK02-04a]MDX3763120.1 fatty acid CoA ligase family protein [Streptomyces sp. AK02-04a]